MLSKPENGWSTFNIGSFKSRVSYLTDVPIDCLNACITHLKTDLPMAIYFDCEGSEFTLVSDMDCTFIIIDDTDGVNHLIKEDVNVKSIVNEIVNDIDAHIKEWVDFVIIDDANVNEKLDLYTKLHESILYIRELLENKGK